MPKHATYDYLTAPFDDEFVNLAAEQWAWEDEQERRSEDLAEYRKQMAEDARRDREFMLRRFVDPI